MNNAIYNFIDWTKGDDVQIAAALGVTRQAVAAARKVRRISPKSNHGGKRAGAGRKPNSPQNETETQKTNVQDQATASAGRGIHDRPPTSGCLHPFCSPLVLVVALMSFVALPRCYGLVPSLPLNDALQNRIIESGMCIVKGVFKVSEPFSGGVLLCPLVATDSVGNYVAAAGDDNSGQRETTAKQIATAVPIQSDATEGNQDTSPSRDVLQGFQSLFSHDRPVDSVINFVAVISVAAHLLYGIAWILTIPVRRSLETNVQAQIPRTQDVADTTDRPERLSAASCSPLAPPSASE